MYISTGTTVLALKVFLKKKISFAICIDVMNAI